MAAKIPAGKRLFKAIKKGQSDEAVEMIQKGFDMKWRNDLHWTCSHIAAMHGDAKVLREMAKRSAWEVDIRNGQKETPLMLAACYGHLEAVKLLIEKGANVMAVDWQGKDALSYCKESFTKDDKQKEVETYLRSVLQGKKQEVKNSGADELRELGNKAFKAGKFHEAVNYYSKAIELDPQDPRLYSNRAATFQSMGELMWAKHDAIKCVGVDKKFLKGHYRLIKIDIKLQSWATAHYAMNEALEQFPDDPEIKKLNVELLAAQKEAFKVDENVEVSKIKGFPPAFFLNPKKNGIFASGQTDNGSIRIWIGFSGHLDDDAPMNMDGTFIGTFKVLVLNSSSSSPLPISLNPVSSWSITTRNGVLYYPCPSHEGSKDSWSVRDETSFVELNGEDVSLKLKDKRDQTLKPGEWVIISVSYDFLTMSEILMVKRAQKMRCYIGMELNTSVMVDCEFDLDAARQHFNDPAGSKKEQKLLGHYILIANNDLKRHFPWYVPELTYEALAKSVQEGKKGAKGRRKLSHFKTEDGKEIRNQQDMEEYKIQELSKITAIFE